MNAYLWLLLYDVMLITSTAGAVWLAKSTKKQFTGTKQSISATVRLLGTICALALTCCLALYVSGVLTYATAR